MTAAVRIFGGVALAAGLLAVAALLAAPAKPATAPAGFVIVAD
jgi:hypothetical protein